MKINPIKNGIVIDHIEAGKGMEVYNFLNLSELECTVALIMNVPSKLMGKKDIIKIDESIALDLNVLGYLSPQATVNFIKDEVIIEKQSADLPEELRNVIKCQNPRCITGVEQCVDHVFKLVDRQEKVYRCIYCESKAYGK